MVSIAEKFRQELRPQGVQQGIQQTKTKIAKALLARGLDFKLIVETTDLSEKDLLKHCEIVKYIVV